MCDGQCDHHAALCRGVAAGTGAAPGNLAGQPTPLRGGAALAERGGQAALVLTGAGECCNPPLWLYGVRRLAAALVDVGEGALPIQNIQRGGKPQHCQQPRWDTAKVASSRLSNSGRTAMLYRRLFGRALLVALLLTGLCLVGSEAGLRAGDKKEDKKDDKKDDKKKRGGTVVGTLAAVDKTKG